MRSPFLGKLAQRRRRCFRFRDGFHLEIAYHYGKKTMVAEFHSPDGSWNLVYADTIKDLFSKIRTGIAELKDPKIRHIRLVLEGKISAEKCRNLINSENLRLSKNVSA